MPNLVDAIGAVLHDGGDGEIVLVLCGGRLRAVHGLDDAAFVPSVEVDVSNPVDRLEAREVGAFAGEARLVTAWPAPSQR